MTVLLIFISIMLIFVAIHRISTRDIRNHYRRKILDETFIQNSSITNGQMRSFLTKIFAEFKPDCRAWASGLNINTEGNSHFPDINSIKFSGWERRESLSELIETSIKITMKDEIKREYSFVFGKELEKTFLNLVTQATVEWEKKELDIDQKLIKAIS